MGSHPAATLSLVSLLAVIAMPVLLTGLAWKSWNSTGAAGNWRGRVTLAALICASAGSLAMPLLLLIIAMDRTLAWLDRIELSAIAWTGVAGTAASLVTLPLAALAQGRIRWLALPASLITLVLCYTSIVSASY